MNDYKFIKMTPSEYAAYRGITLGAVTKRLRDGLPLTGVSSVLKYSRFYVLTVKYFESLDERIKAQTNEQNIGL